VNVPCPAAASPPARDDTNGHFICLVLVYYLRYSDPHKPKLPFERHAADRWLACGPVPGRGIEHGDSDLLYPAFSPSAARTGRLLQLR